ncbi:hypothetical protein PR048_028421 [Dryococelus australis]|uniref:Uncharacterized protein n=1 Tax=Dryococelus australis TaxID=614101 RepID=A0ABQ9GED5_9NEOP|nr:hypothetical protein PR048_028421 [Dryococelus australis]
MYAVNFSSLEGYVRDSCDCEGQGHQRNPCSFSWLRRPEYSVEAVFLDLFEGQRSQSPDAYIDLLFSESALNGTAVVVLEDLIIFAVNEGRWV